MTTMTTMTTMTVTMTVTTMTVTMTVLQHSVSFLTKYGWSEADFGKRAIVSRYFMPVHKIESLPGGRGRTNCTFDPEHNDSSECVAVIQE